MASNKLDTKGNISSKSSRINSILWLLMMTTIFLIWCIRGVACDSTESAGLYFQDMYSVVHTSAGILSPREIMKQGYTDENKPQNIGDGYDFTICGALSGGWRLAPSCPLIVITLLIFEKIYKDNSQINKLSSNTAPVMPTIIWLANFCKMAIRSNNITIIWTKHAIYKRKEITIYTILGTRA